MPRDLSMFKTNKEEEKPQQAARDLSMFKRQEPQPPESGGLLNSIGKGAMYGVESVNDYIASIGDGATGAGIAEKAAAGTAALGSELGELVGIADKKDLSDRYKENLDLAESIRTERRERSPISSFLGNVTGSVGTLGAVGPSGPGVANALGRIGSNIGISAADEATRANSLEEAKDRGLSAAAFSGAISGAGEAIPSMMKAGAKGFGWLTGGADRLEGLKKFEADPKAYDTFLDSRGGYENAVENQTKSMREPLDNLWEEIDNARASRQITSEQARDAKQMALQQLRDTNIDDNTVDEFNKGLKGLQKGIGEKAAKQSEILANNDVKIKTAPAIKELDDALKRYQTGTRQVPGESSFIVGPDGLSTTSIPKEVPEYLAHAPEVKEIQDLKELLRSAGKQMDPAMANTVRQTINDKIDAIYSNTGMKKSRGDIAGHRAQNSISEQMKTAMDDDGYRELMGNMSKDINLKNQVIETYGNPTSLRSGLSGLSNPNAKEKLDIVKQLDARAGSKVLPSMEKYLAAQKLLSDQPQLAKHLQSLPESQRLTEVEKILNGAVEQKSLLHGMSSQELESRALDLVPDQAAFREQLQSLPDPQRRAAVNKVLYGLMGQKQALQGLTPTQTESLVKKMMRRSKVAPEIQGELQTKALSEMTGKDFTKELDMLQTANQVEKSGPNGSRLVNWGSKLGNLVGAPGLGATAGAVADFAAPGIAKTAIRNAKRIQTVSQKINQPLRRAMFSLMANKAASDPKAEEYTRAVEESEDPNATLEQLMQDPEFKAMFK